MPENYWKDKGCRSNTFSKRRLKIICSFFAIGFSFYRRARLPQDVRAPEEPPEKRQVLELYNVPEKGPVDRVRSAAALF
jgi:hypothetical protein